MRNNELKQCRKVDELVLTNTEVCINCEYVNKCSCEKAELIGKKDIYKLYVNDEMVRVATVDFTDKDNRVKVKFYNLRG